MRESSLERGFRKRVRALGGYTVKMFSTEVGVPDRLVMMPGGRMYLVELKTDGYEVSDVQRVFHQRMAALGITVVVLRDTPEVVAWLRRITDEHAAATPLDEPDIAMAADWADYRSEYGARPRDHKAFCAGWQAARGLLDLGGVLR